MKLIAYTAGNPYLLFVVSNGGRRRQHFGLADIVHTNVDSMVVFTDERSAGGRKSKQQPHLPYRPNGQRDLS